MADRDALSHLADLAKAAGPLMVVLVGPNGAGKSTFHARHLKATGLHFINADLLARTLVENGAPQGEATERLAARLADQTRREKVAARESFITETVFSDPVGAKVQFLRDAQTAGYTVILIFVCVESAELSVLRVQTRVLDGGHDVPREKIPKRYERMRANVRTALTFVDFAILVDNSSLDHPLRPVAATACGRVISAADRLPWWAAEVLP